MEQSKYWIHDLSPFLWEFPDAWEGWGPGGVRWYGISYLLGFLTAIGLLNLYYSKNKSPYNGDQIMNMMTFQVLGVLIGGRMGFVFFYQFSQFLSDPFIIFKVWEGGMSSHGGFIGVTIATIWYSNHSKQSIFPISDLIASIVPPGLFFGRIANFINGELYGKQTQVAWGVLFPSAPDFSYNVARHPSQLYAAVLEGLIPFIFVQYRFWKTDVTDKIPGRLAGEFLILYSCTRILNEIFREPDAPLIIGFSRGQFYSFFLILGGIVLIWLSQKNKIKAYLD